METIEAIAKLWSLALILFFILFILLFRSQIKGFLDRLTRFQFRKGDAEVIVGSEGVEPQKTSTEQSIGVVAVEEKSVEETSETVSKPEPTTVDEWNREMVIAFLTRDTERGDKAFEKLCQLEEDANKKLIYETRYLWLRYQCGDTSAFKKLQDLAKREELHAEVKHSVQRAIGQCYRESGDFDNAVNAFEAAAEIADSASDRARDVVDIGSCLYQLGKQPEASSRVMQEIGHETDTDAIFILYNGLASLYELAKDFELRAIALEKAIEISPNDTEIRFDAGYSYGEKGWEALALLHYKTLLDFNSEHASALNNIAVEYKRLEMPIHAAEFYKKAIKLNETLSAANIAYQFMNAGFAEEASDIINKVKQQEKLHPSVGKALAAINEKRDAEAEKETKAINSAREQQRFVVAFGEAYFTIEKECPQFSGSWQSSDGTEMEVTQNEAAVEATWVTSNGTQKFTGIVSNRGAKVKTYEEQYSWSTRKNEFVEVGVGYAYIIPDGQELHIMFKKDSECSFMTLTRE